MYFDIASQASAIDDSFFLVHPPPARSRSSNDNDAFVSGSRSGHWTVSSGGNRSDIDDRTPTIHGVPASSEAGSAVRVKKVDGAALRKLAVATEAQKKVEHGAQCEEVQKAVEEGTKQAKAKLGKAKGFYLPKLQGNRGIRVRSRDGNDEIIKDPAPRPTVPAKSPATTAESKQPVAGVARPPSPSKSVRSVAAASNTSKRTPNGIRIMGKNGEESFVELPFILQSMKSTYAGRYHKEEERITASSPKPPAVPAAEPSEDAEETSQRNETAEKEAKRLRDERTAAEAKHLRVEHAAAEAKCLPKEQTAVEAKRVADNKAIADAEKLERGRLPIEAAMHGALPASSKAASVVRSAKGSKGSSKVSEKGYPAVFDPVSKPVSIASSTTSVSKTRNAQQQQAQLSGGLSQRDSAASLQSRPQKVGSWQEVGFGTYEAAASNADRSQRSNPPASAMQNAARPSSSKQGAASPKGNPNTTISFQHLPASRPGIPKSPQHQSKHDNLALQDRPPKRSTATSVTSDSFPIQFPPLSNHFSPIQEGPTVFAGRGWISPHPFSEAPTWARSEPDPLIQLPRGASLRSGGRAMRASSGVATMTYEEWLKVQNETNSLASGSEVRTLRSSSHARTNEGNGAGEDRRNFSRTSSHASQHYGGGSWGHRAAGAGTEGSGNYRAPSVRTESERGSWQRQASVRSNAKDLVSAEQYVGEDGNEKTHLAMPWDGQLVEEEQGSTDSGRDKFF